MLRVAVGLLVVSITAPGAARAAPTPGPTLAPARQARVAASPIPARLAALGQGSPSPAQSPLAGQAPTQTLSHTATPVPSTPTATPTLPPTPTRTATDTPEAANEQFTQAANEQSSQVANNQSAEDDAQDTDAADAAEVDWQAFVPTDTADHLATMDRAARNSGCGVPWQLLAAIARVESDFGRNMATSSAGAVGYGQFLPSSWQAFGNDGNVYDYRAALPAIATYLCQSGLATDPRAALFAYNHADWYVDLVLDLAVRYDRMAPGAPTPDVLALNPAADESIPLQYAPGRDVRLQARPRALDDQARWLGIPWRGRRPGTPISASSLQTTTLAMIRAAFGLSGDVLAPIEARANPVANVANRQDRPDTVMSLVNQAWAADLFANPNAFGDAWSVAEIRQRIESGQPVVALLNTRLLPGHPASDVEARTGDQPVLVIGVTPAGLILSDPAFSSSLGYGLEMSDAAFVEAWQVAETPLQALAFSTRPEPPLRDEYFREPRPTQQVLAAAVPSQVSAPPLPTVALETALPTPAEDDETIDPAAAAQGMTSPDAGRINDAAAYGTIPVDRTQLSSSDDGTDMSWVIVVGAALFLSASFGLRRRRARQPP